MLVSSSCFARQLFAVEAFEYFLILELKEFSGIVSFSVCCRISFLSCTKKIALPGHPAVAEFRQGFQATEVSLR